MINPLAAVARVARYSISPRRRVWAAESPRAYSDRTAEYAKEITDKLRAAGLRAESDLRNEKIGYKIREAQLEKIPYMFIIGDKEAESGTVSVRSRKSGDEGAMKAEDIIARLVEEDKSKKI